MIQSEDRIFRFVEDFPNQIYNSYFGVIVPKFKGDFDRIVIVGMGGSYIAGLLFKEFLRDEIKVPVEVYPGEYPNVNKKTFVILISYSGNTKEVLSAYKKYKKNNVLILTSGGKLERIAKKDKKSLIKIPENLHQRFTFSYGFFPLLRFFEDNKVIKSKERVIKKVIKTLKKNKPTIKREAAKLALKVKNKNLLFYSSNYFYPAAYRFQTSIEEDAKVVCHANRITELFHNELEAFPNKDSLCLLLIDGPETKRYTKQINYFKKLINFYEIKYKRYSKEERIFVVFYFVDFFGFYLSRIRHTKMGETLKSDRIKKL